MCLGCGWDWRKRRLRMFPPTMVPEGECESDDEEHGGEPAPGELAGGSRVTGFATHRFFDFAGFIFKRFGLFWNERGVAGSL